MKTANTRFFSYNFSQPRVSQPLERRYLSHINFLDVVKNAVFGSPGAGKTIQRSTWKSYVRKSAAFTAQQYSCSEILSENGEKYPEN